MVKDNKINIKLEVCRDKTSGKLIIMAHFDSKAPNVFIDKDNYSWMPTFEEHDLINEAFDFFPIFDSGGQLRKTTVKEPEIKEESKQEQKEELKIEEPIIKKDQEIKTEEPQTEEPQTEEPQTEELPPLEANDEPAIFEKVEEETKPDEFEKIINDAINEKESEKAPIPEEPAKDELTEDNEKTNDDKKNDEGVLVEADGDAIERALKKHKDSDKDESMVEADEQMIIDKVLSQKKKGKWSKK